MLLEGVGRLVERLLAHIDYFIAALPLLFAIRATIRLIPPGKVAMLSMTSAYGLRRILRQLLDGWRGRGRRLRNKKKCRG